MSGTEKASKAIIDLVKLKKLDCSSGSLLHNQGRAEMGSTILRKDRPMPIHVYVVRASQSCNLAMGWNKGPGF